MSFVDSEVIERMIDRANQFDEEDHHPECPQINDEDGICKCAHLIMADRFARAESKWELDEDR